jgi:hypothetical protein
MNHMINRKAMLGLGVLGLLALTVFGNSAFAHDRDDYRDGWRNRSWNYNRVQKHRYYRPVVKKTWVRPGRVAYLPGNRWGYYKNHPAPRRGWW